MSAANKQRSATVKEERRARRRRRKVAAATSTMLLVAAAVAGEPIGHAAAPVQPALGVGGGLFGLTDPEDVSANGEVGEDDRIGDEVLRSADDIDRLLELAKQGDLPTGQQGLPGIMAEAYQNAANRIAVEQPACGLHWSLLAAIGRIESNHARGGRVDAAGNTVPHILGPVLNGGGFAAIRDTDGGGLDGDARWDRAVGAMQFIPSTWTHYASDGNDDGVSSPHNVWDATLAAGKYLCSGGMDLADQQDVATAVFRYNHSDTYVATVMLWAAAYRNGTPILPSEPVLPDPDVQALGPQQPSLGGRTGPSAPPARPPAARPGTTNPSGGGSAGVPGTTVVTTTTTTTTSSTSTTTKTVTVTATVPCDTTVPSTTTTTEVTTTPTEPPAGDPAASDPAASESAVSTTSTTTSVTSSSRDC